MLNEISPTGSITLAPQPAELSKLDITSIIFQALNTDDYEFTWTNNTKQPYHGTFSDDSNDIDLYIYAWNITPADRDNPSEKRIQIRKSVNDVGINRPITKTEKTLLLGIYNSPAGEPIIAAWDPVPNRNHGQKSCYVQVEDLAKAISVGIYATKDKHGYSIYTMLPSFLSDYVHLLKENNALISITKTKTPRTQIKKKNKTSRKKRVIRSIENLKKKISNLSETEQQAITKVRIGQGYFKELLLDKYSCKCALCDIHTPQLLIASHIKAWSNSNDKEKLDENNGLLLCAHHDALFDKHLISFKNNGELVISPSISEEEYASLNINSIPSLSLTAEMIPYIEEHRSKLRR